MNFIGDAIVIPFSAENGEGCDTVRLILDSLNEEGNVK